MGNLCQSSSTDNNINKIKKNQIVYKYLKIRLECTMYTILSHNSNTYMVCSNTPASHWDRPEVATSTTYRWIQIVGLFWWCNVYVRVNIFLLQGLFLPSTAFQKHTLPTRLYSLSCYHSYVSIVHRTIDRDPGQFPEVCRVKGEKELKGPGVRMFSSYLRAGMTV